MGHLAFTLAAVASAVVPLAPGSVPGESQGAVQSVGRASVTVDAPSGPQRLSVSPQTLIFDGDRLCPSVGACLRPGQQVRVSALGQGDDVRALWIEVLGPHSKGGTP